MVVASDHIEENDVILALSVRLPYFAYDRPFRAFTEASNQAPQRRLYPAACTAVVAPGAQDLWVELFEKGTAIPRAARVGGTFISEPRLHSKVLRYCLPTTASTITK